MAQFDVHRLRSGDGLVVDVQSDLLEPLNTRVVVPLIAIGGMLKPAKRLNPVFEVGDTALILATQFLAAIPVAELGSTVENLSPARDQITAALDMLYQGF